MCFETLNMNCKTSMKVYLHKGWLFLSLILLILVTFPRNLAQIYFYICMEFFLHSFCVFEVMTLYSRKGIFWYMHSAIFLNARAIIKSFVHGHFVHWYHDARCNDYLINKSAKFFVNINFFWDQLVFF